VLIIIN